MRQRLTFYLTGEQLEYLRREAARRRRSLSSYVADCVLQYHQQAQTADGRIHAATSPPFDALLRESEQRLTEFITKQHNAGIAPITKQFTSLAAMLDRFVMSFLLHAPEIPPERQSSAISSAERRYQNWRQAVIEMVDASGNGAGPEHAREEQA